MTSTTFDHHVSVLLENDVGAFVEVEDGDAGEFGGSATGLRGQVRTHQMNQSLKIVKKTFFNRNDHYNKCLYNVGQQLSIPCICVPTNQTFSVNFTFCSLFLAYCIPVEVP
jgi:hypothetical protein